MLGKVLGGTILAFGQGIIFLLLAPTVGIHLTIATFVLACVMMLIVSFALTVQRQAQLGGAPGVYRPGTAPGGGHAAAPAKSRPKASPLPAATGMGTTTTDQPPTQTDTAPTQTTAPPATSTQTQPSQPPPMQTTQSTSGSPASPETVQVVK